MEQKDYSYKEYDIPKKNGKFRKIVAPSQDLLNYQRKKLKEELEPLYNKITSGTRMEEIIHGFVPGRNCVTLVEKHIGYNSTVIMDLSNFFDTVKRKMFDNVQIYNKIVKDNLLFHGNNYCAQGFATSPMLANLAFIPVLEDIDNFLKTLLTNYQLTIYADDIQISTQLMNSEVIREKIIIPIATIIENHKFKVNPNKTRIRYAKYGYRKILGINVGDTEIRATRKTMRKIRAARHKENGPSLGGLTTWSKCYRPKKK